MQTFSVLWYAIKHIAPIEICEICTYSDNKFKRKRHLCILRMQNICLLLSTFIWVYIFTNDFKWNCMHHNSFNHLLCSRINFVNHIQTKIIVISILLVIVCRIVFDMYYDFRNDLPFFILFKFEKVQSSRFQRILIFPIFIIYHQFVHFHQQNKKGKSFRKS